MINYKLFIINHGQGIKYNNQEYKITKIRNLLNRNKNRFPKLRKYNCNSL